MDLLQLESIVTTQLKVRVPKLTNNKYPKMSFTNEISDNEPSFPNVYIHELEPTELGTDLENKSIHAFRSSFQIEVTTNTSKSDARIVSSACVNAMKALRYSLVSGPTYTKNNNIHRFIIRARRVIANGDTL